MEFGQTGCSAVAVLKLLLRLYVLSAFCDTVMLLGGMKGKYINIVTTNVRDMLKRVLV